jgi:high affinity Mn2+ porin
MPAALASWSVMSNYRVTGWKSIVETCYRLPLGKLQVTADYQLIVNPGYNRDHGPVSVISVRLRTQF